MDLETNECLERNGGCWISRRYPHSGNPSSGYNHHPNRGSGPYSSPQAYGRGSGGNSGFMVGPPCYLQGGGGLTVGGNMNLVRNRRPVIQTFEKRLSQWKACKLSVGGRIILITSVLDSLPVYFSLFKAPAKVPPEMEA